MGVVIFTMNFFRGLFFSSPFEHRETTSSSCEGRLIGDSWMAPEEVCRFKGLSSYLIMIGF
jgi:hypothetical protein